MRIILNKYIPFKGFLAINLFGVVFIRRSKEWWDRYGDDDYMKIVLNHERIHTIQANRYRTKWLAFYTIYLYHWVINLFKYNFNNAAAYYSIPFEIEAFENETNFNYK